MVLRLPTCRPHGPTCRGILRLSDMSLTLTRSRTSPFRGKSAREAGTTRGELVITRRSRPRGTTGAHEGLAADSDLPHPDARAQGSLRSALALDACVRPAPAANVCSPDGVRQQPVGRPPTASGSFAAHGAARVPRRVQRVNEGASNYWLPTVSVGVQLLSGDACSGSFRNRGAGKIWVFIQQQNAAIPFSVL